jgi:hypothetical protein
MTKSALERAASVAENLKTVKIMTYGYMLVFLIVFALFSYFVWKILYGMYDAMVVYRTDIENVQKLKGNTVLPNGDNGLDEYPEPEKDTKYQDAYYIDDIDDGLSSSQQQVVQGKMKKQIDYRKSIQPTYRYGANININNLSPEFDNYVYPMERGKQKSFFSYLFV